MVKMIKENANALDAEGVKKKSLFEIRVYRKIVGSKSRIIVKNLRLI